MAYYIPPKKTHQLNVSEHLHDRLVTKFETNKIGNQHLKTLCGLWDAGNFSIDKVIEAVEEHGTIELKRGK